MTSYDPFDLSSWCNTGAGWVKAELNLATGEQLMRGLPFRVAEDGDGQARVLGFGPGGYAEPVDIPLGRPVQWVIFGHRLLESQILEGEPVGHCIAVYRFRYEDGGEVEAPIRERLEIGVVPDLGWGHWPLLAVPDQSDWKYTRSEGPWEEAGDRQTEVSEGSPKALYLWAWRNPHPDRAVAGLRIEPQDRRFVVAAITLSSWEEYPFGREPRRPVKITLADGGKAPEPFDLAVEVDRGSATYVYPLPAATGEEFISDPFKGWGQPYNESRSPAYVEIAAQPSATVRLKQGEEELASVQWADVTERGAVEAGRARIEVVDPGKNWVHVTVIDEDTGKPVPCRVHFRSPEGIPYQPHGHHDHLLSDMGTWHFDIGGDLRLGHVTYAYIDGTCQGWLPRGDVIVDVARGFEYEPLRTTVAIAPGQQELTLQLKRWTNMNAERWFSGDSHVHFLSTIGAQREAQGEDLNVVNLLQSQWGHLFTNTEEWIGRPVATPDGGTIVYTTQENRQHILGHLTLLGLKQPVMPWCSGGPGEAELGGTLEVTLSHWADACHAQGGTVVIPHLPAPNCEPATLIATGRADAVEMLQSGRYQHLEYYRYLNAGYRLPLVGGTDKMTSNVPVGLYRTYVNIPPDEPFDYDAWCTYLRHGRTFLSSGPILRFTVDGAAIGDTIALPRGGGTVEVEAVAESTLPIHTLEIVQAGQVVASTEERQGTRRLRLKATLPIDSHTWLAARVGGPGYHDHLLHHDWWSRGIMAHTSPIYVAAGEPSWMFDRQTAQYMLTLIEGGRAYIRDRSRQHPHGTVTHHHGQHDHLAYLDQPFREAAEAIHRRMHELGM